MIKGLEVLDSIYQNKISKLPVNERVAYCERLIDKVQLSLVRNKRLLSKTIEVQLATLMQSAQQELKTLKKNSK